MEAFIIADRVLTKEHMTPRPHQQLKYLKKYDMPLQTHSSIPIIKKTKKDRWNFNQNPTIDVRKTKNLLSSLLDRPFSRSKVIKNKDGNQQSVDKYFRISNEFTKDTLQIHKTRNMLLVRRLQPHNQHYDINIDFVSRRNPSWGFNSPSQAKILQNLQNLPKNRVKTAADNVRNVHSHSLVKSHSRQGKDEREQLTLQRFQKRIYDEMCTRSGIGEPLEIDNGLQFSSQQLSRCTAQIFKKYQLDKDVNYQKFIADMH